MTKGGGHLEVYLFGAPRLERDNEPLSLNRSKALALLAYLCADPVPHTRDALLDLLWPLFEPADGRNNLRRELSILKSTLPMGMLLADRTVIGIDPAALREGQLWVDSSQFEALLARAETHNDAHGHLCPDCLRALTDAVALYTDDFLAGFSLPDSPAFDEWQFFQAEHKRQGVGRALDRLVSHYEQAGEVHPALSYAQRRAALDPLHEPAQRSLMALYARTGQQAAALRQYEMARELLQDELQLEPEPATLALVEAIRSRALGPVEGDRPPPTALTPPSGERSGPVHQNGTRARDNLPGDATRFIGRGPELAELDDLLEQAAVRLLTVTGVGGIGKTRLSLAAARRQIGRLTAAGDLLYPDGVYWVPLAPVDDPDQIPAAVARAIDLSFAGDEQVAQQVIRHLRHRRLLLLLDNLEHLLTAQSAAFLADLLANAPDVTLLVTSRTRLNLRGEHPFTLDGLDVPALETLALSPVTRPEPFAELGSAVALFQESARRTVPGFVVDEDNIQPVLRICRLVEGMPLAIELAASWLEMLDPEAIVREIEQSLDFLEAEWQDVPARQSSLRAVFNTSWRWLTPEEQHTLRHLTVFRGGFDRAAAEAVAGATLRVLHALVVKNWLHPAGRDRYQIHELLRQYAAEELAAIPGASEEARQRHAGYYADFNAGLGQQMRQARSAAAYGLFECDLDNIRLALGWLVEQGEIGRIINDMMPALFRYMESRYSYHLLSHQIEMAEAKARELEQRSELSVLLAIRSAFFFNDSPTRFVEFDFMGAATRRRLQEAWELMPPEPAGMGYWSTLLAWQYARFIDCETGLQRLKALLALFRERGMRWELAFALQCSGRLDPLCAPEDARSDAHAMLQEAGGLFAELTDEREQAATRLFIGLERWTAGEPEEALRLALAAQERLQAIDEQMIAANVNWLLADIAFTLGYTSDALDYLQAMGEEMIAANRAYLAIAAMSRESYEAVRYGDLDRALERRLQSMALTEATQNVGYHGWNAWELGELYRVRGELDEAKQWYDVADRQFQQTGSAVGPAFCLRGMGDLALARGQNAEAIRLFGESLQEAQQQRHDWLQVYLLARLGRAGALQNDLSPAISWLIEALETLAPIRFRNLILVVLTAVAHLYLAAGRDEAARALAGRVLSHPLLWRETRREAAEIMGITYEEAVRLTRPEMWDVRPEAERQLEELKRLGESLS